MKPKEILNELKNVLDKKSNEFTCILGKNGIYQKKTFNKKTFKIKDIQNFFNFQKNERPDNNKGVDDSRINRSN